MAGQLGAYVRIRRETLDLTQENVAVSAGIGRSHLSQIESGKIGFPNAEIRRRLANVLRVRHVDLLVAADQLSLDEVANGGSPPRSELDDVVDSLGPQAREALLAVARQMARSHPR